MARLQKEFAIQFIVDTGADSTSLSASDWREANLVWDMFDVLPARSITGYGGVVGCKAEPSELLLFHEDGTADRWRLDVELAPATAAALRLPSILGRDVLGEYVLTMSHADGILTLGHPAVGDKQ